MQTNAADQANQDKNAELKNFSSHMHSSHNVSIDEESIGSEPSFLRLVRKIDATSTPLLVV
ncbi:MAG: hypothetical protein AB1810_05480 [Pseudomonadota bacterium]